MKLLITGSRDFQQKTRLKEAIEEIETRTGRPVTMILHGGAQGADTLAEELATERGILTHVIKPDYETHQPKQAPLIRNRELVKLTDLTLAVYAPKRGNRTGGTWYTAQTTHRAGKLLFELLTSGELVETEPVTGFF